MRQQELNRIPLSLRILCILGVLFLSLTVKAQSITQVGTIVDKNNEPMIGVTVQLPNGNGGTITDLDGKFSINVEKGTILTFSYVGYNQVALKSNRWNYERHYARGHQGT